MSKDKTSEYTIKIEIATDHYLEELEELVREKLEEENIEVLSFYLEKH